MSGRMNWTRVRWESKRHRPVAERAVLGGPRVVRRSDRQGERPVQLAVGEALESRAPTPLPWETDRRAIRPNKARKGMSRPIVMPDKTPR